MALRINLSKLNRLKKEPSKSGSVYNPYLDAFKQIQSQPKIKLTPKQTIDLGAGPLSPRAAEREVIKKVSVAPPEQEPTIRVAEKKETPVVMVAKPGKSVFTPRVKVEGRREETIKPARKTVLKVVGNSVKSNLLQFPKTVAIIAKSFLETEEPKWMTQYDDFKEKLSKKKGIELEPRENKNLVGVNFMKNFLQNKIIENTKEQQKLYSEIADDKEGLSNPAEYGFAVSNGITNLGMMITATAITKNPKVAFGLMGALESSDVYNEARSAGKDPKQAMAAAVLSGAGTAYLESLGWRWMFGGMGRNVTSKLVRTLAGGVGETATEVGQTWYQNLVNKFSHEGFEGDNLTEKISGVFEGTWETIVSSIIPGLIGAGGGIHVDETMKKRAVDDISDKYDIERGIATQLVDYMKESMDMIKGDVESAYKKGADLPIGLGIKDVGVESTTPQVAPQKPKTAITAPKRAEVVKTTPKVEKTVTEPLTQEDEGEFLGIEAPKKKTLSGKEQLRQREQAKLDREEVRAEKESLQFFEEDFESQYQDFKKLRHKNVEDVAQLKEKNKNVKFSQIDNMLYSQEKSIDEVFNMFKDRYETSRMQLPEIPKETKAIVAETARIKERVKSFAKGIREGRISTKKEVKTTQESIIKLLKESNLEAKDKAKFISKIKNVQTANQLMNNLPEIENRIFELEENAKQRDTRIQIKKDLKNIKPSGAKPKGKFTPEIQNLLNTVKSVADMSSVKAEEQLFSNLEEIQNGKIPTADEVFENQLLELWSGRKGSQGLNEISQLVQKNKESGLMKSALKAFNRETKTQRLKEFTVDRITGGKRLKKGVETEGIKKKGREKLIATLRTVGKNFIMSWRGLMTMSDQNNSVLDQKMADTFETIDQDNKFKELTAEYEESLRKIISESYGIKDKSVKIQKKITSLQKEVNLGTFKNADGVDVNIKFTKDELIKRWMELQDETLEQSFLLGNKYTVEIINVIDSAMTDSDKKFAKAQIELYKKQYKKINPIYREMYGVDLPSNPNYSPVKRSGYKESTENGFGEFMSDASYRKAVTSNSFITRQKNILPIEIQGSVQALDRNITETNYFVAWANKMKEFDSIFSDPNVKLAYEQEYTPQLLKAIQETLNHISTNGNKTARIYKPVDFFRKNFTVGVLMAKPSLAAKQLVSLIAYMEKLNPIEFTTGLVDFFKNPKKNFKTLQDESVMIKRRGVSFDRDIKAAMDTDSFNRFSKRQSFVNTWMSFVRFGDKGAIVLGSWALRKARLKQGVPINDIVREYEVFSSETQQSSDLSRLSNFQRGGTLEHLFSMFKTSMRQYLAKEVNAVRSLVQKDGLSKKNVANVAKTLVIYHVVLPVVFQFISNFGGWDEEDKKEYLRAAILGNINGLFIFGDIADKILRMAIGLRVWDESTPIEDFITDVYKAIEAIDMDDISNSDIDDIIKNLSSASAGLGIPAKQAINMYGGVVDVLDGDLKEGVGRVLGWSEYQVSSSSSKDKKSSAPRLKINAAKLKQFKLKQVKIPRLKVKPLKLNSR